MKISLPSIKHSFYFTSTCMSFLLCQPMSGEEAFENAIRPITAPTIFDLAVPRTQLHGIYLHQNHPSRLNTTLGSVPVGGDFDLYALQFEITLDERTSIVAVKDGYIDFNPNETLSQTDGFANLGIGLKRALIYRPENEYILSGIATLEFPTGDSEVWQGEGDGALNLNLSGLKLYNNVQIASNLGLHIPFDSEESFTGSLSLHGSYRITNWFIPLIEMNWYHVFHSGDGSFTFDDQGGNLVSSIARFEAGDLINFGATNSDDNRDAVTLGLGFRSELSKQASLGFAYEIPLTDQENGILKERFTFDVIWQF